MPSARKPPPELPNDPVLVGAWRKRINQQRTSIKQFVEFYKVPTKRVALLGSAQVQFREYPAQAANREVIESQWAAGEGGKEIDAKPRQDGHTTGFLSLFWERFMRAGGGTWNLFSYDEEAVQEVFRIINSFRTQTPPWVFTHLMRETLNPDGTYAPGGGIWKKGSSRQLHLVWPDGVDVMLQCLTAGDQHSGSGSAPRGVLFDEFSKWKPSVKRDTTSMSEGWLDAPGNIFAIPSTGQGPEEFGRMFMEAWHSPGHRAPSGFVARFTSWLGHPDRREEFKSEKERAEFVATIGTLDAYGPKEEQRLVAAGAVHEELLWRRRKIAGLFQWNLPLFSREYPLVPEDMFASSPSSALQIEILQSHAKRAAERALRAVAGEFIWRIDGMQFVPVPHGAWLLFEPPAADGVYCFGTDVSSGKTKLTGTSKEPDFSVDYIGELYSGRTCARFRSHMGGRNLAIELFKAAVYFNGAKGYIERNQHGELVIDEFEQLTFKKFRGDDLLLLQHHPLLADGKRPEPTSGWTQSKKAKERWIRELREFIAEVGEWTPEKPETPFCPLFIGEGLFFERDASGNASAVTGHDDCVNAKGLFEQARREVFRSSPGSSRSPVKPKDSDELKAFKQVWAAREAQEREAEEIAEEEAEKDSRRSPFRSMGY